MKKSTLLCALFLLGFCFMTIQPFCGTANALDYGSLTYYSLFEQTTATNSAASDSYDIINYIFGQHSGTWTERYDGYGTDTNLNNILNKADDFEANHDGIAFLHYGHWWTTTIAKTVFYYGMPTDTVYINHWTYYPSDYNTTLQRVKDCDLFPHTDQEKHCFVLLWTCVNGYGVNGDAGYYDYGINAYPYYREATGAVGMPYAFTQHDDLRFNSHLNPDSTSHCFIGFKGTSKDLTDVCEYTGGAFTYQYFLCDFYYHALNTLENYTIKEALDATCEDIWGAGYSFDNSPIHSYEANGEECGMIVWGNPSMSFPK